MTEVLGVDGWRGGWVGVVVNQGRVTAVLVSTKLRALVEEVPDAAIIAVDIPLGFPAGVTRRADRESRAYVQPRGPVVFPAPPRCCFDHLDDYAAACTSAAQVTGKKISKQAFALLPKMVEADREWRARPRLIFEVHPEVSFRALKAAPVLTKKKTSEGIQERTDLLQGAGLAFSEARLPAGPRRDDFLDAAVAAWSAQRIANQTGASFPTPPEQDAMDPSIPVAIWY